VRSAALGLVVVLVARASGEPVPLERPDVARAIPRTCTARSRSASARTSSACGSPASRASPPARSARPRRCRFHTWEWRLRAQRQDGEWLWSFDAFDADA
jgi:hypothetical protein